MTGGVIFSSRFHSPYALSVAHMRAALSETSVGAYLVGLAEQHNLDIGIDERLPSLGAFSAYPWRRMRVRLQPFVMPFVLGHELAHMRQHLLRTMIEHPHPETLYLAAHIHEGDARAWHAACEHQSIHSELRDAGAFGTVPPEALLVIEMPFSGVLMAGTVETLGQPASILMTARRAFDMYMGVERKTGMTMTEYEHRYFKALRLTYAPWREGLAAGLGMAALAGVLTAAPAGIAAVAGAGAIVSARGAFRRAAGMQGDIDRAFLERTVRVLAQLPDGIGNYWDDVPIERGAGRALDFGISGEAQRALARLRDSNPLYRIGRFVKRYSV